MAAKTVSPVKPSLRRFQKAAPAPEKKAPLAERVLKCLRSREAGRSQYARADRLLDTIAQEMNAGDEIALPKGKKAVLVDLFAEKTVVYKPLGFRRYELKIVETD